MAGPAEPLVWVRRQWNGTLGAAYALSALERPHWSDASGGVGRRANRLYVHGYVQCDGMVEGELDHSCEHGPPPHRIKVCVVARDNTAAVMRDLKHRADSARRP